MNRNLTPKGQRRKKWENTRKDDEVKKARVKRRGTEQDEWIYNNHTTLSYTKQAWFQIWQY